MHVWDGFSCIVTIFFIEEMKEVINLGAGELK